MTILNNKVTKAKQEGKTTLDLLKDPYDALEAIATLGVNMDSPVSKEQIGDGVRKTYQTNQEGTTLVKTEWTKTPTELELRFEDTGRKR